MIIFREKQLVASKYFISFIVKIYVSKPINSGTLSKKKECLYIYTIHKGVFRRDVRELVTEYFFKNILSKQYIVLYFLMLKYFLLLLAVRFLLIKIEHTSKSSMFNF